MKTPLMPFFTIFLAVVLQSCGGGHSEESLETVDSPTNLMSADLATIMPLDSSKFKLLTTNHKPAVENYYVYIKNMSMEKDSLQIFVNSFRNEYCKMKCNIKLYDDPNFGELVSKYPLSDNEYLKLADHFVAESTFDMREVWMYPFQDIKYKNLGGKNWKKEPIQ
jgi:hypothetical protein